MEGKKVWGRKQVQEPRRCLKCQCFGEHKAGECRSIHNVCGRCGNHHRTSVCEVTNRDAFSCSNCMAAKNNKHIGHSAADRRCPIFLLCLEKMSKSRNESKYKFYCTDDPATWETIDTDEMELCSTDTNRPWKGDQRRSNASGRVNRGGGEEVPATQRRTDNGWEGRKGFTRTIGSEGNSINQIETHKQGNVGDIGSQAKDREIGTSRQVNNRRYKQGTQKEIGASQTMLIDFRKILKDVVGRDGGIGRVRKSEGAK